LCFAVIGKGDENATLTLTYAVEDQSLTIHGETTAPVEDGLVLNELSGQILTALVDEHSLWENQGTCNFSLTKRQVIGGGQ